MKIVNSLVLFSLSALPSAPLLAQTQIGGGTCNSASVNGTYAVSITGRKVSSAGTFTNVFQAIGTATFDGQSKVGFALTSDTNQAVATQLNWSGIYSMQANCAGAVTITTGGSVTLNLVAYARGVGFLLTGGDAIYAYSGSGDNQPTTCSTATLSGVYTVNATGFLLASNAVSGAGSGAGLLQFDGQGRLTVNFTLSATGAAANVLTLTGSYTGGSNCLGSATLTDSKGNSYVMRISINNGTAAASSAFYVTLAQSSTFILLGNAHAIYGQPTAMAATHRHVRGARA